MTRAAGVDEVEVLDEVAEELEEDCVELDEGAAEEDEEDELVFAAGVEDWLGGGLGAGVVDVFEAAGAAGVADEVGAGATEGGVDDAAIAHNQI